MDMGALRSAGVQGTSGLYKGHVQGQQQQCKYTFEGAGAT